MAVYKVPQDVEADDKLIGPFSFRQFIYLIIVAIAGFVGYLLAKVFIGLVIIVIPIILLFGAIALPLRKDQPMETYLVAVVRFLTKPRVRMWSPEGAMTMVTVTAPKLVERHLTKDFGSDEAERRLSYLAQVVDTKGWATRGVTHANDNMSDIVIAEAAATPDMFDNDTSISRSFDQMIDESDAQRRQQLVSQFQQGTLQADAPSQTPNLSTLGNDSSDPTYDPYPASMHQRVIMPASARPAAPLASSQRDMPGSQQPASPAPDSAAPILSQPSAPTVQQPTYTQPQTNPVPAVPTPDIMRLANTKDLSISALAHEAHRLETKDDNEVVISLR